MLPYVVRYVAVGLSFVLSMVGAGTQAAERPNVVLVLVDDLGVMDSSVPFLVDDQGRPVAHPLNQRYRTPNLERLASRGIRFADFSAMSVCSPSRISLMTGQNAARHRTTNWINPRQNNRGPAGPPDWNWQGLGPGDITLARLLQESGYRTFHVGKGHFGPEGSPGSDPTALGFDVNIAGTAVGQPKSYLAARGYGVPHLEVHREAGRFLTDALTAEAKRLVSTAVEEQKPFFLYLPHYAVHAPFDVDERFVDEPLRADWSPEARAFGALVDGVDQSVGELLDHLELLGVAERTLFLFLGDNGTDAPLGGPHEIACAAPLRGKKGSHYEGGTRVPMIAAWAKPSDSEPLQQRFPIARSAIQIQSASIIDLFPTLLEITEVSVPADHKIDGYGLLELFQGKTDPRHPSTFLVHYPHAPHRSDYFTTYREGPWKIIYHYRPGPSSNQQRYQLFHLAKDPSESRDLSQSEPETLRAMMQSLRATLERYEALYPVAEDGITPLELVVPEMP